MANQEFSDVVLRLVSSFARDHINTSMPAKVTNVRDLDRNQVIDVLPLINNSFDDGTDLEYPPIYDVPVIFPSAGGGLLSFPIKVDDTVLLVFSQKSLAEWMESRSFGNTGFTPADKRRYAINDAIAFPGLYTKNTHLNPNNTDVELKFKKMSFKLENSNNITLTNDTHSMTLADNGAVTFSNGASITEDGDFISATGVSLNQHLHVGSASAPAGPVSNTGTPIPS